MALTQVVAERGKVTDSDLTLEISRRFSAPIDIVFGAMTRPEIFQKWWGPKGCTCTECDVDLRVGGEWSTKLKETDSNDINAVTGIYKEIVEPSKLVFTWAWTQPDGTRGSETEVTINFYDEGHKTLMEFSQKIFADPEICQKHRFGWDSAYDCLDVLLQER